MTRTEPAERPRAAKDRAGDPLRDKSRGVRLQRALADAGVASRRHAEALIEEGHVRVNGRVVRELPAWVNPDEDDISVDGRRLPRSARHIYVMLNKPRRTLSTSGDPDERRTVTDLVQHPSKPRLFPVGRLDMDTTGLVLLTNDGELANRLTHPRYGVHKRYRATVKGAVRDDAIQDLERGIFLAERKEGRTLGAKRTAHVDLRIVHREREKTILELTLGEGRNRQVRRMLAKVGHPVRKLMRIEMGPLKLKGLRIGEWRELTSGELGALRRAAQSGARQAKARSTGDA